MKRKMNRITASVVAAATMASAVYAPISGTGISFDVPKLASFAEELSYEGFLYTVSDDGATITGYDGAETDIVIPNEIDGTAVTKINQEVFKGNKTITSVVIPSSVLTVGSSAFKDCSNLERIDLHEGLTTVNQGAFAGTAISEIYIPSTLKTVNADGWTAPFANCKNLTKVTFSDEIEAIPAYVLKDCPVLKEVEIPLSVKEIGHNAFENCPDLTEIVIPSNVETVGSSAFKNCSNLERIDLHEGLTTINQGAFAGTPISKIYIPSTLKTVNADGWTAPFANCKELSNVTFSNEIEAIPAYLFKDCPGLTEVEIPSSVKEIEYNSFKNCSASKIVIPSSVEKIGSYAFSDCSELTEVWIEPGIKEIGSYAFQNCAKLAEIEIPSSVERISSSAFKKCQNLEKITLNEGLKTIGGYAFDGVPISEIYIPSTLENVEANGWSEPFQNCKNLDMIYFGEGIELIPRYLFSRCPGITKIEIPSTVKEIGYAAFAECVNLTEVEIPSNVEKISGSAFADCTNLEKVTLNEGLKDIGSEAFKNTPVSEIYVPLSLEKVSANELSAPFKNCKDLNNVTFAEDIEVIPAYLFGSCPGLKEIEIPSSVTEIGAGAFAYCSGLEKITLNEGLTTLGQQAFRDTAISEIHIPSTLETVKSGSYSGPFMKCSKLSKITFAEGLEVIPKCTFSFCTGLTELEIPSTVKEIKEQAFANCSNLKKVTLNEGLTTLGGGAFEKAAITEITIPSTLTTAGQYALNGPFMDCKSLEHAVISEGMEIIPANLFRSHANIASVEIPDSVNEIGDHAFSGCKNLITVMTDKEFIEFNPGSFEKCNSLTDTRFTVLDKMESYITANTDTASVDGIVNYTIKYKLTDHFADSASDMRLQLNIPSGMTLLLDSIRADQEIDLGIRFNGFIDLTKPEGTITFSARITENGNYSVNSAIRFKYNSATWNENIGTLNVKAPELTISSANITNDYSTEVFGIAEKDAEVNIYVNGELAETVTSNKYTGKYKANIMLPSDASDNVYSVYAVCGETKSASISITYEESQPFISKVMMGYNKTAADTDITNVFTEGYSPVISITTGKPIVFEITAANSEKIDRMFITSTKGEETKYMEAFYNEETGTWIAEGFFDKNNHSYVPGSLNISIISGDTLIVDEDNLSASAEALKSVPSEYKENSLVEIIAQADDAVLADITISNGTDTGIFSYFSSADNGMYIDGEFVSAEKIAKAPEDYGFVKATVQSVSEGVVYSYYIRTGDSDEIIKNISEAFKDEETDISGTWTGTSVLKAAENDEAPMIYNNFVQDSAIDVMANAVGGLYTNLSAVISLTSSLIDYENFSAEDVDDDIQTMIASIFGLRAFRTFVASDADSEQPIGDLGAKPAVPTALKWTVEQGILSLDDYLDGKITKNQQYSASGYIRFVIDPSGIVYEAVEGNRITDAEMTVYYLDPETGNEILWNAEDYDQFNPIFSNEDGMYAWDVPEGKWKVVCQKDGYETLESEWLDVPPVQTNINFSLVSYDVPEAVSAELKDDKIVVKFSKFMDITTVNSDSLILENVSVDYEVIPELLAEGDIYADTYTISGDFESLNSILISITDECTSYAGVNAKAGSLDVDLSGEAPVTTTTSTTTTTATSTTTTTTTTTATTGATTTKAPVTSSTGTPTSTVPQTTTETPTTTPPTTTEVVLGDVNGDGMVDSSDASLVLVEYALSQTGGESSFTPEQKKSADVNNDGIIDSSDASKILVYYSDISTGKTPTWD